MKIFSNHRASIRLLALGAVLSLAACGGGGSDGSSGSGSNSGGSPQSVSGTVAKGLVLPGASISLTCANGAVVSAVSGTSGGYVASSVSIAYPCIGSAVAVGGTPSYRGILFAGGVANFTPLTDMLVQAVLAAAASGSASMSIAEFLAKVSSDPIFAASVTSADNITAYRAVVLQAIRTALGTSKTPAEIDAILAAAAAFESTPFSLGSALDQVLDNTALFLQNLDGSVKAFILAQIKIIADALAPPLSQPTGATGATGASGASGASGR